MTRISVARDFSVTPGGRRRREGAFSGEAFRQEHLAPAVRSAVASGAQVEVDLDGTAGMSTGFIEEAFGGLVRIEGFPAKAVEATLRIRSDEEPWLASEALSAIRDAVPVRQGSSRRAPSPARSE